MITERSAIITLDVNIKSPYVKGKVRLVLVPLLGSVLLAKLYGTYVIT